MIYPVSFPRKDQQAASNGDMWPFEGTGNTKSTEQHCFLFLFLFEIKQKAIITNF